jgi:hypothetical protein
MVMMSGCRIDEEDEDMEAWCTLRAAVVAVKATGGKPHLWAGDDRHA